MKITKIAHIISQVIFNSNHWPRMFTIYSLLKVLELSEKKCGGMYLGEYSGEDVTYIWII